MANCEGERDRAIALVLAEVDYEAPPQLLGRVATSSSAAALIVAMLAYAATLDAPLWMTSVIFALLLIAVVLATGFFIAVHRGDQQARNRLIAARLAIIEAAYRDCVGGEEE